MTKKSITVVVLLAALVTVAAGLLQFSGLAGVYRHEGVGGAVFSQDARHVFYFRRQTKGLVIGPGIEFFTPPARVLVMSDTVALERLDVESGRATALHAFDVAPNIGRWTHRYHGRIFGLLRTQILPSSTELQFTTAISHPTQPTSTTWVYQGTHRTDGMETTGWQQRDAGNLSDVEHVLREGLEVMVVGGREGYGQAIVALDASMQPEFLLVTDDFDPRLMPSAERLAQASRRELVEHQRRFRDTQDRLVAENLATGQPEGEAILDAYDTMREMGLLPPLPTLTARRIVEADLPAGEPVFEIPANYLEVGLFRDIKAAIATPGEAVETDTGDYLDYADDTTGSRLKRWRQDHDVFHARVGDDYYRFESQRPE